jgi:ATP-dependent exoDNAse (exonuclease V) alpha subunit
VVHFSTRNKWLGIRKGSYHTVEAIDRERNSLTLRSAWRQRRINPGRWHGIQVYSAEERTIAVGDRLQFRTHDITNEVANGALATFSKLNPDRAKLRFDDGRKVSVNLSELKHIDYGYCSTSHAAQGAMVDRVIVNANSKSGEVLVNAAQFYVSPAARAMTCLL